MVSHATTAVSNSDSRISNLKGRSCKHKASNYICMTYMTILGQTEDESRDRLMDIFFLRLVVSSLRIEIDFLGN